ncbi:tudor domain-containing 6 isoform X1 [Pseudochaenichthys georgianus]|uniref:tudor domain-containing 6 isoform X1 n=1 Tax=Pseudochaenichthys georgianus TaxID=52239 RepID=UPI00146A471D|nr:tudor domain-containing protein 6 isoform X1 [Pseudochaenichthys georgianus]
MRSDKSWAAGIHENANMSSILGLPARGSDVTVLITKVHLNPFCALVELWGTFDQEKTADYECLFKEIQCPGNSFQEFEGNPSDQCLVQIDATWYRSRIVSRNGSIYSVFLIDEGMTFNTTRNKLAWGRKKHYQLPPKVAFCVLANVLPLSLQNRWSPVALEFLESLSGKSLKAHVQDVLVPHRTLLLHIPCISKQMYEMGIARKLSPDVFQDFVLTSLQSQNADEVSPVTQIPIEAGERLHKKEVFLYPELPNGTVETVIVTEVTNPQRIFCQLKVFSQELKKLSGQITQCCEGRTTNCIVGPEMIGFPCAARGNDGRWYRSVLQQVFPSNQMVEVLNVDYGTKQFVKVENVRPLGAEFFRMPVVTYICSLHGIIDEGGGWTTSQIDYLRTLLLHKTVIAKFEYQSISEGVHYVTLYGDENTNINNLFGSNKSCFLESEKTLGDYAISTAHSRKHTAQQETNQRKMLTPGQDVEHKDGKGIIQKLPAEDLSLNSSHVAFVQHVSDPSEFWIQTQNYAIELDELMDGIYHLYKDSVNKNVVTNPTVGLFCAAKSEDGDFYRATVAEVGEIQVKVFFVDYGNTEMVDRRNIRTLPDDFKKLPCLSLKCTLDGVRPKDGRWSQSACELFIKAVTDIELTVHVTSRYDDGYVVQLTNPDAQGERDLSALMCCSGHAEKAETQTQPKAQMTSQPAILPQLTDASLSGVGSRSKEMLFQSENTVLPAVYERRISKFKEHMFAIGSVLDVSVLYIESPNDFWCQLVQNAGHLKVLMRDLQAHYADTEFQPLVEAACVARHPKNGMWYRALVIHKHKTSNVDVLFVDFGPRETVPLHDLRRISPQFLVLKGQAFRCSLLNPVDPTSAINDWNEEAVARFHSFVETSASDFVTLKCTIYAVMYSEQKVLFNIVDLETPFESICTSMVNLVKSAPPKKVASPSFRLDTYYYSTHNVKTGTEEQVTVTSVNNVSQFYCQLERNADVMKDLKIKVNNLCFQLEKVKLPTVFGTLCFARYTDGQWYRGQIKATQPAILVQFVDYGDTIEVDQSDLLPVPREAIDIMSVPVQAVVCSLSDVPADVPSEANSWFETSSTECTFRALVVAREPDGKLLIELYQGNTQVNSKIKKMFQIEMQTEGVVVCQGWRAPEASANYNQKTANIFPKQEKMEDHTPTIKNMSAPKPARQIRDADINLQSLPKTGQKIKGLYILPHLRQTRQVIKSKSPDPEKKSKTETFPKLADLPTKSITSGMEADVYVSHCNSPLSFYVQLVSEEDDIFSIVEKLNDPKSNPQTDNLKDMSPGDLVQAEFADDSSWYRAVVREIHGNTMALVEFVDFGNTAMVPLSKMGRLHKSFLQLPMYSTQCLLRETTGLGKEDVLAPEVVSAFKEDIGANGEKTLKCQFFRQSGSVWEVGLEDSGVNVICKVPTKGSAEIPSEKLEVKEKPSKDSDLRNMPENSEKLLNSCSLSYHQQDFSKGQKLEVYVTAIDDVQTFWCQPADSEELDQITSRVSEVGDAADHKPIDTSSLSPGNPCIALFSDDGFWYRAQVIDKDGDELSVVFVDYGNKSQINNADVREMPCELMETPPQAFRCELEGFDALHGSWNSNAVDEFSALTTDKVLQLTVTRVTREGENVKCLVRMECEGRVLNEALKIWWKSSTTGNQPAVGLTTTYSTPLLSDSTVKETAPPEDQLPEDELGEEIDATHACIDLQRDHSETQSTGNLIDFHADVLASGSRSAETMLCLLDNEGDQDLFSCDTSVVEADKDKEEGFSMTGLSDENPTESIDESENTTTDLESLSGEINNNTGSGPTEGDGGKVTKERGNYSTSTTKVKMVSREAVSRKENVDLLETYIDISEYVKQIEAELMLPSCVLPAFDAPSGREIDTVADGVSEEELPCVATHVEDDLMTGEETLALHEDKCSALPLSGSTDSEQRTSTAPSQDLGDEDEEGTCSEEETSLTDVSTDLNEPSDDSKVSTDKEDCLGSMTAEETVQSESQPLYKELLCELFTEAPSEPEIFFSLQDEAMHKENNSDEDETSTLHEDELSALSSDSEPQASAASCPDLKNLVEEVTCLVGGIHLTEVCTDQLQEAEEEEEEREQPVGSPPEETEDVRSSEVEEQQSSSADDSFEAQLSMITHLSLIINDSPADPCLTMPEE